MKVVTNDESLKNIGFGSLVEIDGEYYILCDPNPYNYTVDIVISVTAQAQCVNVETGKICKFDWERLAVERSAEIIFK